MQVGLASVSAPPHLVLGRSTLRGSVLEKHRSPGSRSCSQRRLLATSAAALGIALSAHRSSSCEAVGDIAEAKVVELAVVDYRSPRDPTEAKHPIIVLVHGLDSWSGTWSSVAKELSRRGLGSVAVDLRGHGLSPLGSPEDFEPAQLAADVRAALVRAGVFPKGASGAQRIVLVGHSMGGKVSLRYAANYPEDLKGLMIEDMDCVCSRYTELAPFDVERRRTFDRSFPSWEAAKKTLMSFGYDADRVDGWARENPPRVMPHPQGSGVWSAINPHAQWLARRTVLATGDAYEALQQLAAWRGTGSGDLAVHVLVAGPKGTVCSWDALPGGIRDMESVLPGLVVSSFPTAPHSIHNGTLQAFVDLVDSVAKSPP